MNKELKIYLESRFNALATKEDFARLETDIAHLKRDMADNTEAIGSLAEYVINFQHNVEKRFDELIPYLRMVDQHEMYIRYLQEPPPKLA
ncbi:MAG: hypothetical protein JWL80_366 [Parcubacteria group bacterium]|nr:hypothetical protein [Parcubacteria group bacterium]